MCKFSIKKIVLVLTVGILSAGCGSHGPQGGQKKALPVEAVTMRPERLVLTRELPGRTSAFRVAEIRPQVNGLIMKREFDEGALVKEGELLYQIDPAPYQAAYDQAKAAVDMAEADLPAVRAREERYKELVSTHAVGQQDYDNALAALRQSEARLEASKATLEMARINLSYTPIKSPISGRIGRSSITEGAMVTAYQPVPLSTVQQLDPIYVDVTQSTAELLKLQNRISGGGVSSEGSGLDKVTVIREDGTVYPLEGELQFRDITVNPATGSVVLRIEVPNPESVLLPGMFVRAVIKEGVVEDAILVPQVGVSRDVKGEPFSWVVDKNGKAAVRMLTLDRAIGNKWLVADGLRSGDKVILTSLQSLRSDTPVVATPAKAD
jgi:membrane fusion protein, multidrug efflux system